MKTRFISFVIGQAPKPKRGKEFLPSLTLKSAPHYFEAAVPSQFIVAQEKLNIRNLEGTLLLKTYQPDFLIAEVEFDLPDVFFEETLALKEEAINYCRDILKKRGCRDIDELSEEYSIYAASEYKGDPEQFFKYQDRIASLLKSEKLALDPHEIEYTLSSNLKYAKNDLVIVDWDGAFLFDPEADFASTIELLELANLQLLKYRLLDYDLDKRLGHVMEIFKNLPEKKLIIFGRREVRNALTTIMQIRAASLFDFQGIEREIKLIGDWYSARLYELAAKKFKFDEWRRVTKEKLDAIEGIYSIASEKFSLSPEVVEMIGWFILLFGWTIILIFDLYVTFFKD